MRNILGWLVMFLLFGLVVGACSSGAPPVKPAADRPTFLYFYTEN